MNKTGVPYATHALHAVRGCTMVSPGCESCYACRLAATWPVLRDSDAYKDLAKVGPTGKPRWKDVRLCPKELQKPLRRRPRPEGEEDVVFVCDMGDLFHEKVPFEYIAAVFGVMAATPHICYLLLTKRAKRMREFYEWLEGGGNYPGQRPGAVMHGEAGPYLGQMPDKLALDDSIDHAILDAEWPLPNVWCGVSVESQDYVHRIEELLKVPAAGRWVSYEPGLGPLDVSQYLTGPNEVLFSTHDSGIRGIITGCESGPGRRPFELDWARSLRDQCKAAGAFFYFKQAEIDGRIVAEPFLDGRQHLELPWKA